MILPLPRIAPKARMPFEMVVVVRYREVIVTPTIPPRIMPPRPPLPRRCIKLKNHNMHTTAVEVTVQHRVLVPGMRNSLESHREVSPPDTNHDPNPSVRRIIDRGNPPRFISHRPHTTREAASVPFIPRPVRRFRPTIEKLPRIFNVIKIAMYTPLLPHVIPVSTQSNIVPPTTINRFNTNPLPTWQFVPTTTTRIPRLPRRLIPPSKPHSNHSSTTMDAVFSIHSFNSK